MSKSYHQPNTQVKYAIKVASNCIMLGTPRPHSITEAMWHCTRAMLGNGWNPQLRGQYLIQVTYWCLHIMLGSVQRGTHEAGYELRQ